MFLTLLPLLLNSLPSIISLVETVHGPTNNNGTAKLATAVSLAQVALPQIVPHLTGDPQKQKLLEDLISFAVQEMQATGMLPVATTAAPLAQPAQG